MLQKKGVVIHCSNTTFGSPLLFDDWHKKRGFGISWPGRDEVYSCGYHAVGLNGRLDGFCSYDVLWDGVVSPGRPEEMDGAHAKGVNSTHLGYCLVGKYDFTHLQLIAMHATVRSWMLNYGFGIDQVIGHTETMHQKKKDKTTRKTCPNVQMNALRNYLVKPNALNTVEILDAIETHNLVRKGK